MEEQKETERLQELAEKLTAESRIIYDEKTKTFNMNKRKVTDYKKSSCLIFPRAQCAEKESKLEVVRLELMEQHKKWVRENCNCKGEQLANLNLEELEAL